MSKWQLKRIGRWVNVEKDENDNTSSLNYGSALITIHRFGLLVDELNEFAKVITSAAFRSFVLHEKGTEKNQSIDRFSSKNIAARKWLTKDVDQIEGHNCTRKENLCLSAGKHRLFISEQKFEYSPWSALLYPMDGMQY